jgi:acetyl esterase
VRVSARGFDSKLGGENAMSATGPSPADRVEIAALRTIGALPKGVKRRIAGKPIHRDGLELDLDMQVLIRLDERKPRAPLSNVTPIQARSELARAIRALAGPQIPVGSVRELAVAGAEGPLRARLYVPEEAENGPPGPLIVFYHGGGWVQGDLDTHDQPCRLLARSSGARVLSVDYRLAPEHPFPAPMDDALAAFSDAVARARELGADPARVAVAGDSAGGHLAAVTAQQSPAHGGPTPALQLLIYPVTDLVNTAASRETFATGFVLTKESMDWYERQLMGEDGDRGDPRASPLLASELSAGTPTLLVTAGFDPLRDEGEAYARRLSEAGAPTIQRRFPGFPHGFINMLTVGSGPREALVEMGGVLRAALAH